MSKLTNYFYIISWSYLGGILLLPWGLWNYSPLLYIFAGPIFLTLRTQQSQTDLNLYTQVNHHDLMRKYGRHNKFINFSSLTYFAVRYNIKVFKQKEDDTLSNLVDRYLQRFKLLLYSFICLILITFCGFIVRSLL